MEGNLEGVTIVNTHTALSSHDPHWSPVSRAHPAPPRDLRLVKGMSMAKISIVSRRRRDSKLPETAAQRRARGREFNPLDEDRVPPSEQLDGLVAGMALDLPDLSLDDLVDALPPGFDHPLETAVSPTPTPPATAPEAPIQVPLSPEQSQLLEALPFVAQMQRAQTQILTFDLQASHDNHQVILQFSPHAEPIPEMLSLKELCQQLKVGRRAVLRLIREGRLRCYRIGQRYRFAAVDVKRYLEQSSSQ